MELMGELGAALRRAATFEEASDALIRAGRRLNLSVIAAHGGVADIGCGKVYLYPDEPRVVVHTDRDEPGLVPSRSAWRLIQAHGRPIILDAKTGEATLFLEAGVEVHPVVTERTCQQMLDGGVTHLHVLPLFGPGGPIGALSFEVRYSEIFDFEEIDDDVDFLERAMTIAQMTTTGFELLPRQGLTDALCTDDVPVARASTLSILQYIDRHARRTEPIVLRGPTGSGRTHLARWCHTRSARTGAFEVFDPTLTANQLEDLDAGWRRAQGGTLLIRRPDRLDARAQERLVAYCRLADPRAPRLILHADDRWTDVVEGGDFDAELAARVQDLTIPVGPLRDRPEEIEPWARHFALEAGGRVTFTADAVHYLSLRDWPQNLIGLKAVVCQAREDALERPDQQTGTAVIQRRHLLRVPYVSQGQPDMSRQEARLINGLEAIAEVIFNAGEKAIGAEIEGMAGLVLWRLRHIAGGRDEALDILGRTSNTGNSARTWRRKRDSAVKLAQRLGLDRLVDEL